MEEMRITWRVLQSDADSFFAMYDVREAASRMHPEMKVFGLRLSISACGALPYHTRRQWFGTFPSFSRIVCFDCRMVMCECVHGCVKRCTRATLKCNSTKITSVQFEF